jgi:hypothetical protein
MILSKEEKENRQDIIQTGNEKPISTEMKVLSRQQTGGCPPYLFYAFKLSRPYIQYIRQKSLQDPFRIFSLWSGLPPIRMCGFPIDSLLRTNKTIRRGRNRRRGMRETKKERKRAPSSKAGQGLMIGSSPGRARESKRMYRGFSCTKNTHERKLSPISGKL